MKITYELVYKYYHATENITSKEWIKNWRKVIVWRRYYDHDISDIKDLLQPFFLKNKIPFCVVSGWLYCMSNRKIYNDVLRITNDYYAKRDNEEL